ncbi:Hypothetical predicted protein [Pelobates cultripes]|uniref:Uncharacterized protein n=1 Tax=Pelobates cultripes TaxID=61616 RepID=A0AAD1RQE9_PELCU|nr:Hypothetical predicted protein [Pelobates cultripes]
MSESSPGSGYEEKTVEGKRLCTDCLHKVQHDLSLCSHMTCGQGLQRCLLSVQSAEIFGISSEENFQVSALPFGLNAAPRIFICAYSDIESPEHHLVPLSGGSTSDSLRPSEGRHTEEYSSFRTPKVWLLDEYQEKQFHTSSVVDIPEWKILCSAFPYLRNSSTDCEGFLSQFLHFCLVTILASTSRLVRWAQWHLWIPHRSFLSWFNKRKIIGAATDFVPISGVTPYLVAEKGE